MALDRRRRPARAPGHLRAGVPLRGRDRDDPAHAAARTPRTAPSRSPSARRRAAGGSGARWADSGLMFSVALYPSAPVARWPELTLVAAEGRGWRGRAGSDDQGPERRPARRPEGGGDPRRGERAGRARHRHQRRASPAGPAPASSSATGSSCSSTVLERLEHGYDGLGCYAVTTCAEVAGRILRLRPRAPRRCPGTGRERPLRLPRARCASCR